MNDTQETLKNIQKEIRNIDDIEIIYDKTYIGAFEVDKILEKYINKENKDE